MTFLSRGVAHGDPEGVFLVEMGEMDEDEVIGRMLCHGWQRLFPLRNSHGARIRRVLARMSAPGAATGAEARAAFGLDDGSRAPGWLYRDFYVDAPPGGAGVDRAIGRLRRGDGSEMLGALGAPDLSDAGLRCLWYEVSTLSGRLAGTLRAEPSAGAGSPEDGGARDHASWDGVRVDDVSRDLVGDGFAAGWYEGAALAPRHPGREERIGNRAEVMARIQEALGRPMGIDAHRAGLIHSLDELLGGGLDETEAAACMELLIHHTDLTFRQPLELARLGAQQAAGLYRALLSLQGWLCDPVRFLQLVRAGLSSPSRQRRFLSCRLLRLDGHLDDGYHPDDVLPGPVLRP